MLEKKGIETEGKEKPNEAMEGIPEQPEDSFLAFIQYARSVLSHEAEDRKFDRNGDGDQTTGPAWNWIVQRILKTCTAYSSGVTAAILLSDLFQAWHEQNRTGSSKRRPECIKRWVKNHPRPKLPNTVTIDSIYEKNFLSLSSVLEAVIIDAFVLPGTNIYMLSLGDYWSSNTINLFLHRRYYDLVNPQNGILKKGREIFLTGCHLRTAAEGSGYPRLLPTEYLVILLDEEHDDDAMLLGAQFCSDSFSSISMDEVSGGASYSLYARIESIGTLEIQGDMNSLKKKQIILVDNDGFKLKFLLWGDQVVLANLLSVGSMLALDRPYIATFSAETEPMDEVCLEYGSVTQLYLVPFIPQGEQVSVALSQTMCQGSRMLPSVELSQEALVVSQVILPCDSQGLVDFTHYPFRTFVVDLRDKMTGISLYGVIRDMSREENSFEFVFCLTIEDTSGAVCVKLHFCKFWTLKRLNLGHTVYISGLTCSATKTKCLELVWYESNPEASLFNISSLPAILNSPCLRHWSSLSELCAEGSSSSTQICRVWIDQIEHCQVDTRYSHTRCGHFLRKSPCFSDDGGGELMLECSFCGEKCVSEVSSAFYLQVVLSDEVGGGGVFAWCMGQTATELLQISPDEFSNLPEDEQLMYPSSLEKEKFVVALVHQQDRLGVATQGVWEITCALKSN